MLKEFMSDNVSNRYSLSLEMIQEQNNDYVVKELNDQFDILVSLYKKLGVKGKKFHRDRDVKKVISNIDRITTERFGMNTHQIYGGGAGYAVFTAPPKNYNVVNRDIVDNYNQMKDYASTKGKTSGNTKGVNEIEDSNVDEADLIYRWVESVDALDKEFTKSGITVDLQKAKILNLPKDYNVFVLVDFDMLVGVADFTGSELTATYLHEIGHAFTHIEYSYRTVNNTAVLADSIQDVINGNSSYKKALKLSYNKFGGDTKDIENANVSTATVMTIDKYMKSTLNMNSNNTHSKTDSEQLADQFSSRFGLAGDLSNALSKLKKHELAMIGPAMLEYVSAIYLHLTIGSLLATGSIMGALIGPMVILLGVYAIYNVINAISDFYTGGSIRNGTTYDFDKRRHKRIRNELIRQIRSSDLPKALIKEHLNTISILDNNIDIAESESESIGVVSKLGRVMLSANNEAAKAKEIEELIEDIMENDIYIASNKLKNI